MNFDRAAAIAASRAEVARLGKVSIVEVTPSRRDFGLYAATQKQSLAVIADLSSHGGARDQLLAAATELDDAEVAALALSLTATSESDVREVSAAVSAPLLRLDYTLASNQLYFARLQGFDAIVMPATEIGEDLDELVAVASSLHMSALVEVATEAEIAAAQRHNRATLSIRVEPSTLDKGVRLAAAIDHDRTLVALTAGLSLEQVRSLTGSVDAALVGIDDARRLS